MNLDDFKKEVLENISKETKIQTSDLEKIIEKPNKQFGDLALPCFIFAKKFKKDPKDIAEEIAKKIKKTNLIKKIEAKGPYVNFFADWEKLGNDIIETILKQKEEFGRCKKTGKKILVEHTSANPDGPLHLGHFRNSVLGDCISKILSFSGNDVKTESWVNDTGRQIAIAVYEYMKSDKKKPDKKSDWWVLDLYLKGNREIEKNPEIEDEIKDIIRRFESGDEDIRKKFLFITEECIKGHKETLNNLNIKIDNFFKESDSIFDGSVNKILENVKKLPEGRVDGKRIWVDLKKFGIEREFTLTREDGTTIYSARDLAYHEHKFRDADFNVNIIGTDQKFYFKQLKSVLSLLYPEKTKNYHIVFYEFLLLPEGTMSTRAGKFVSVDDVIMDAIKEAEKTVNEKMPDYPEELKKKIARVVGIGALKYAMIKVSPEKTYAFNIKDTLKFEGDTAPYIQYTYARCKSILRKAKIAPKKFDVSDLKDEKEIDIIKKLAEFPETILKSAEDFRPHYIANYLYDLATLFNEFYHKSPVITADEKTKVARLALVESVSIIIKNGLNLLGIDVLEKM